MCHRFSNHHDISVATLGSEEKCPCLVSVNWFGEVLYTEECFMSFGEWDVMQWWVFALDLDPNCLVLWFFPIHCGLLIRCLGVGLLSALLLSCLSWGSSGWWVLLSVLAMLHSFRCGWHQWRFFWWEFCWCMLPKKSFAWAWEIKDDIDLLGDFVLFVGIMEVGIRGIKV